jgi:hypothetical protein
MRYDLAAGRRQPERDKLQQHGTEETQHHLAPLQLAAAANRNHLQLTEDNQQPHAAAHPSSLSYCPIASMAGSIGCNPSTQQLTAASQ